MAFRKKPRKLDLAQLPESTPPARTFDLSTLPEAGPPRRLDVAQEIVSRNPNREELWRRLGSQAWDLLHKRRMRDLFPEDGQSEFERYIELRRRVRGPHYGEHFIGLNPTNGRPVFVPRVVFTRHGYVLGGSGSGKSSHALPQLIAQMVEPYDWEATGREDSAPILIIDLKQHGDPFLYGYAQRIAAAFGRPFRTFSTDPTFVSLTFEPFYSLRTVEYPLQLCELLLKALSLVYPEGYGSDFFTSEQRVQLMKTLYNERPRTLRELVRQIRAATEGSSGNRDARGLYSALASFEVAMHLDPDGQTPPEQRIDFDRFFSESEILYVHLDSRNNYLLSREVGKLMLYSLMETASQRVKACQKRQAFVLIDEFQRLAANNIVELLEDARSSGVSFMLAHQSASSLLNRDADLYGRLFENCSFKQFLTLEDPRVIELLRLVSPRVAERRATESTTSTEGSARGSSTDTGNSAALAMQRDLLGWAEGTTETEGSSRSRSESRSSMTSSARATGWSEEMVSALTPEVVAEVNDMELRSIVHVKGTHGRGLTPTGSVPTQVQGLYPVVETEFKRISDTPWPRKHVARDDYYRRARPSLPRESVDEIAARPRRQPTERARPEPPTGGEPPSGSEPLWPGPSDGNRRALQARIRDMGERLAGQMLGDSMTLARFARKHGLSHDDAIRMARALNIQIETPGDRLQAADVALLLELLNRAGR